MKKIFGLAFIMSMFFSIPLFAQHTVNDIARYGGWYQARVEISQSGNIMYYITQCYPSGDEYEVIGTEREQLPLYLKILCMGMVEEGMKDSLNFDEMTFDEDGIFMQLTSFSFTFLFNFSENGAEILNKIGNETVNKYRYRRWP
jgi:hypothetical protein